MRRSSAYLPDETRAMRRMEIVMEALFVPLSLIAGGLLAVQAGANTQLAKATGSGSVTLKLKQPPRAGTRLTLTLTAVDAAGNRSAELTRMVRVKR